jgi:hypothetical protein
MSHIHFDAYTTGQPSVTADYHRDVSSETLTLKQVQAAGGKISRIRLLGEAGYRDISYIHATLADGRIVRVNLNQCPGTTLIPANKVKTTFIEWAKAEGVYAKGLGLLDDANYSILI